jgi:hypothetical protein
MDRACSTNEVYRIVEVKPEGERPLRKLRGSREDDTKMNLRDVR